jgi:hypothetical protein
LILIQLFKQIVWLGAHPEGKYPGVDGWYTREIKGNKKINKNSSTITTSRLKYIITSINDSRDKKDIREFVDNYFLARDTRAFREHLRNTQPDVDLTVILDSGEEVLVPIGLSFFWPDLEDRA